MLGRAPFCVVTPSIYAVVMMKKIGGKHMTAILMLIVYAVIMIALTIAFTGKNQDSESFYVGKRNMGTIHTAMSIAATWIWAPALFTSAQKAYENGFAGLFYFLVPNVACLLLFTPFARRIREEMPNGITLSGYMGKKYHSEKVRKAYHYQLAALSVLSTAVQLLAGGKVLSMITGIPLIMTSIILAVIALSYSVIAGIKASVLTDVVQMLFMLLACVVFVPMALHNTAGRMVFTGISGEYTSLFSGKGLNLLFDFGLPTAIGLFAGPFGDQCFWQRAFSVRKDKIESTFRLGALFFAIVPFSMGLLGFIAAGAGFIPTDNGMVNFELIKSILPAWTLIPFMFMLISGLLSTVDSNLCAAASLTTDKDQENKSRGIRAMLLMLIIAIVIANIPGLTVTHMFLFYGTFRASTMLPTILTLKNVSLKADGIVYGIIASLVIGIPIFSYGNILNIATAKTVGSLLTVLLSGIVALLYSRAKEA